MELYVAYACRRAFALFRRLVALQPHAPFAIDASSNGNHVC